jgi:hypothetical protein
MSFSEYGGVSEWRQRRTKRTKSQQLPAVQSNTDPEERKGCIIGAKVSRINVASMLVLRTWLNLDSSGLLRAFQTSESQA